jgi:HD-GYP domain-containing protein (c-di-GMP phosphodiesterase class II)
MALLVLCIPILVAMNYRSSKLAMFTAIGSAVCALFFPVFGLIFNTWAVDYFYLLIWCVTGEHGDKFPQFIQGLHPMMAALIFVGTLYFNQIVAITYCLRSANKRQERIHQKQIEIITKSRDSMLAGMASVVENRDNNTGGHIKRTSEVIKILTGYLPLEDSFREDIIKAAPLHDLGKIAIPGNILNKPGRLTDAEFEFIKIHPQKGYEIVCTILSGLDDERLLTVAENIALYHHEKYNGQGYPKGLKGDEIPLEARIMAVADVYDALVSKRVYKEAFDFEKANRIILEGMGTQFDPGLKNVYLNARSKLEAYYAGLV